MGFYDSVKDRVRSEEESRADRSAEDAGKEDDAMPFDHLKKQAGAEEDADEETRQDDDIEVLASGERVDATRSPQDSAPADDAQPAGTTAANAEETATRTVQEQQSAIRPHPGGEGQDALISVLRNIEEQNADILNVLRGIKRSLDGADGP